VQKELDANLIPSLSELGLSWLGQLLELLLTAF
jgi:hypothetical protein